MSSQEVPNHRTDPTGFITHAVSLVLLGLSSLAFIVANRALMDFNGASDSRLTGTDELFFDPNASSPQLIYAVTAAFLVARWARLRASFRSGSAPILTVVLLGIGSALTLWAHYIGQPQLHIPAVAFTMVGLAAGFCGRQGARTMVFPAIVLLLAFPIPRVLVNQLMYPLQQANATGITGTLRLLGVDAMQSGEMIAIPGRAFQVIESCSGLRGFVTMLMSAAVYIELFARRGRRAVALVLCAPLIAILMNHLRILSIIANPYATDETVHAIQGVVMIVVGVLCLAGLDQLLDRWSLAPSLPKKRLVSPVQRTAGLSGPLAATAVSATLAGLTLTLGPWSAPADQAPEVSGFPLAMSPWQAHALLPIDRGFLESVSFDRCTRRDYTKADISEAEFQAPVGLLMCTDLRTHGGDRMLSDKLWSPGAGWSLAPAGNFLLPDWPHPIDISIARKPGELQVVVAHWRAGTQPIGIEILRGTLGLDRGPFRRTDRAIAVRVSTPLDESEETPANALQRIIEFLEVSHPEMVRMGALRKADGPDSS